MPKRRHWTNQSAIQPTEPSDVSKEKNKSSRGWPCSSQIERANLGVWERQRTLPNKSRLMCSVPNYPQGFLLSFLAAPCCPKTATICKKKRIGVGGLIQWFPGRIGVSALKKVATFFLQRSLQLKPLSTGRRVLWDKHPRVGLCSQISERQQDLSQLWCILFKLTLHSQKDGMRGRRKVVRL